MRAAPAARTWSRYRYPGTLIRFLVLLAALVFVGYAFVYLDVRLERLLELFSRLGTPPAASNS
jgi:hypothetical protein